VTSDQLETTMTSLLFPASFHYRCSVTSRCVYKICSLRRVTSLTLIFCLVLASIRPQVVVDAFKCGPCDIARTSCPTTIDCLGGTTPDSCGCCLECARVVNESCGGFFFLSGKCDQGLVCVIAPVNGALLTGEEVGVCRGKWGSTVIGVSWGL